MVCLQIFQYSSAIAMASRCSIFLILTLLFASVAGVAQVRDSVYVSVEDTAFVRYGKFEQVSPSQIQIGDHAPTTSMTSVHTLINTVPGVRMEERSPGSYRLNMRGSSLRAPFGVRNVDIYWNNIPLTDPGGSTYFNQVAYNNFTSMNFVKSTASTIYGAGTGGQILIEQMPTKQNEASLELIGGSYGLKTMLASGNIVHHQARHKLTYAHNQTEGYRVQSDMLRDNLSWVSDFKLSPTHQLTASVLYANLYYQTPGALTLAQYEANPKAARPASGIFPSAEDAKAAIFQDNLTGGLTLKNKFFSSIISSTTVYGSYNNIKNSAIRNYEKRVEPHFGGRQLLGFSKKFKSGSWLNIHAGAEIRTGQFSIKVFGNKVGKPDTLQTNDKVATSTYNLFTQFVFSTPNKWTATAAIRYNKIKTAFTRLSENPALQQPFSFSSEWVPRVALTKSFGHQLNLSAMIAKSFSAPTIGELLPSTGIINTSLQAEKGWNYELVLNSQAVAGLSLEASLFSFRLRDALVQRRDNAGADYFINAGGARQNGVELFASYAYVQVSSGYPPGY